MMVFWICFFFSSRRRHTRCSRDWSSDVCSSDLVWFAGGVIALLGAFIYAELADRYPDVGGQYAYLREAYHPSIAFLYGWALLLVVQTGGMAAVAVTFSHYFLEITRASLSGPAVAALALGLLTIVNCLGVRAGSSVQNA